MGKVILIKELRYFYYFLDELITLKLVNRTGEEIFHSEGRPINNRFVEETVIFKGTSIAH